MESSIIIVGSPLGLAKSRLQARLGAELALLEKTAKRKRDAELECGMKKLMLAQGRGGGVAIMALTEASSNYEPPENIEVALEMEKQQQMVEATSSRGAEKVLEARRKQLVCPRLPFELYHPVREEQYLGNLSGRKRAHQWVKNVLKSLLQRTPEQPKALEKASLLLYGAVGTGKSSWARFIAKKEGFSVSHFSMADHGELEHQKLHFWLQAQPSHDLRGRPVIAVLDDVEELLRAFPSVRRVRPRCPVICTAGSVVDPWLRLGCSEAIRFEPLGLMDAGKVVRSVLPGASDQQIARAQTCARGDIRQLQLVAHLATWNLSGAVDMSAARTYDRARLALTGDGAKKPPSFQELCEEEPGDCAVASIIHYNFVNFCRRDQNFLSHYVSFLEDAVHMDVTSSLHLLPASCRKKVASATSSTVLEAPPKPWCSSYDMSHGAESCSFESAQPEIGAYAPPPNWVNRRQRFRTGDDLCANLLLRYLGKERLSNLSLQEHRSGEPLHLSTLSRTCMMTPQRALEWVDFSEAAWKMLGSPSKEPGGRSLAN